MAPSCSKTGVSFRIGLFLIWVAVASQAAIDHQLLTVHMLEHLLPMTLAPRPIWLVAHFRPLLHGLPERFIESLLVPSGAVRARDGLPRPWKTVDLPGSQTARLVGLHVPALFASAK